ncbi:hypothetical protein NDU88_002417 [Pleurodeles waltl]|uniref:Uncharacterized protein n=1 Tax=Pleurodeles waltl TaxID=8319 RepID=A0AAV7UD52_PLEWA|nr:hypothetical protein NDU88_002417 [Pleurodeles waltl]
MCGSRAKNKDKISCFVKCLAHLKPLTVALCCMQNGEGRKSNVVSDCLSMMVDVMVEKDVEEYIEDEKVCPVYDGIVSKEGWKEELKQDRKLKEVMDKLEKVWGEKKQLEQKSNLIGM